MEITSLIFERGLILIPMLYIIGMILKDAKRVPDKYIPVILLPIGLAASFGLMGFSAASAVQRVLITGDCVYGNQLGKQLGKAE